MEKKNYEQSKKLDNVCYDIRGPVMDEAMRMEARAQIYSSSTSAIPPPFGFYAPDEVILDMIYNLRNCEGYSDSRGLFSARKAIMQYCQLKGIPNVGINDIFTGNGVSELITLTMQGLLTTATRSLSPRRIIRSGRRPSRSPAARRYTISATSSRTGTPISTIFDPRSRRARRASSSSTRTTRPARSIRRRSLSRSCRLPARTTLSLCRRDLRPSRHAGRTGAHRARLARARTFLTPASTAFPNPTALRASASAGCVSPVISPTPRDISRG